VELEGYTEERGARRGHQVNTPDATSVFVEENTRLGGRG